MAALSGQVLMGRFFWTGLFGKGAAYLIRPSDTAK